jgi:hypothetical protein
MAERPSGVVPVGSRFRLDGVVAPTRNDAKGLALIAVDGQSARAFRIGDAIAAGFKLGEVSQRGAVLMADDPRVTLVLELASPNSAVSPAGPSLAGATDATDATDATPGTTRPAMPESAGAGAGAGPASSGGEPGPLVALPAEPGQALLPARSPGSSPDTLGAGRRNRLRGLKP